MPSTYLLAIDDVSVTIKLSHIAEMFRNIAHVGRIYASWSFAPEELDRSFDQNVFIWQTTATQKIFISIAQWKPTPYAYELQRDIANNGSAQLCTLTVRPATIQQLSDVYIDNCMALKVQPHIIRLDYLLDHFQTKYRPISNIKPIPLVRQTNQPPRPIKRPFIIDIHDNQLDDETYFDTHQPSKKFRGQTNNIYIYSTF
jgi:hypothetical protein